MCNWLGQKHVKGNALANNETYTIDNTEVEIISIPTRMRVTSRLKMFILNSMFVLNITVAEGGNKSSTALHGAEIEYIPIQLQSS